MLREIWGAVEPAHEFILAILLSLVTAWLLAAFRPKVKLTWGSTSLNYHRFKLSEEGNFINVATEKLFVQNVGKKAASNIELVMNDQPTSYTLWPPRDHKYGPLEGGGYFIKIETLAPSELLIVDTIDIDNRNPRLVTVNCPDTLSNHVEFEPQRKYGKVFVAFVGYLMFAGLVGSLYVILNLILRLIG